MEIRKVKESGRPRVDVDVGENRQRDNEEKQT